MTEEIASWICLKLDYFKYPRMQPAKLFVVEALGSQVSEIVDGDLLVVDSSWRMTQMERLISEASFLSGYPAAGSLIAIAPFM